jgi:hypothetical protein
MDRRSFLRGLIAAPAIVTFGNLMPVRGVPLSGLMLHHKVLTAQEVLEQFGELEVMRAELLKSWTAAADLLLPPPRRMFKYDVPPPYSE